jgi:mono/diheme cytochrome c family protein
VRPGICAIAVLLAAGGVLSQSKPDGRLSDAEAKKLKSPVPYTKKSIAQGKTLFARACASCHGPDGKAQVDVVADATDLTAPQLYKSGASEGEIFRSIRDGAGETMPPFKTQISPESELWHLVNFTRSLWPESERPPLQEEKPAETSPRKKQRGNP